MFIIQCTCNRGGQIESVASPLLGGHFYSVVDTHYGEQSIFRFVLTDCQLVFKAEYER